MGIEIIAIIISSAVLLPVVLGMLFNASFTRPTDNTFYNVTGTDSTIMSDDSDNDYFQAVGQIGTLLDGKRINSVSVDMANTNNITAGTISIGVYSIVGDSITLEKQFGVVLVSDIPIARTTFQYDTDYIMDSNDSIMLVASGFESLPTDLITVYLNFANPISDSNMVGRSAFDLMIDNFAGTDIVSVMVKTVQTEDTEFITIIGMLVVIALILIIIVLLRSAIN